MRRRTAWVLLVVLCGIHGGIMASRLDRRPEPLKTFHDHDARLLQDVLVLSGWKSARQLPARDLRPPGEGDVDSAALWGSALANSPTNTRLYQTILPLHNLVVGLPSLIFGISPRMLRLGTLPLLWALLLLVFDLGHRLSGRRSGGLAAALLVGAMPATASGLLVGTPVLGNMLGATLGLWALIRSDGLSRLGWAILAGLLIALAPRWGESAGDGVEVLLVLAGPVCLTALLPLWRLCCRRWSAGLTGLMGLCAAVLVGALLLDRWWLALHLSDYLLAEAGSTEEATVLQRIWGRLGMLQHAPWAYPETLVWSLLGPAGAAVVGLGALLGLRRPRWTGLLLWAAALGAMAALTLSEKRQDYYVAPLVPVLSILGGAGLVQLRRLWPVVAAVALVAWLFQAHADTTLVQKLSCRNPTLRLYLAGEVLPCGPYRPEDQIRFQMYHYFREWRREPDRQKSYRANLGGWAAASPWVDTLAPGALVLLQRPSGQGGGADALYYILQARRPDVHVHVLTRRHIDEPALSLLEQSSEVWLLTLIRDIYGPQPTTEPPIPALSEQAERVEHTATVSRYRIRAP